MNILFLCKSVTYRNRIKALLEPSTPFKLDFVKNLKELEEVIKTNPVEILLADYKTLELEFSSQKDIPTDFSFPIILLTTSVNEKVLEVSIKLKASNFLSYKNLHTLQDLLQSTADIFKKYSGVSSLTKSDILANQDFQKVILDNFPRTFVSVINRDLIVIYNGGAEFTNQNLKTEEYLGKSVQEIHKHFGEQIINRVTAAYLKTFQGEPQNFVIEIGELTLNYKTMPLVSLNNQITNIVVLVENISQLITTQTNLVDSEAKYRETIERITDGFVALDKNWNYTYMNKKAGELLGCDPDKLIGKNIWKEFPDGVGQPFHLAYEKAMAEQKYIYLEEYYPPFNRWFEDHIYPSPNGISIYFRDVTRRKRIENELQNEKLFIESIVNASPDIIYIYDLNKQEIVYINEGLQKNFGYTTVEIKEMGNQLLSYLMHPDDLIHFKNTTIPLYKSKKDKEYIDSEFRMLDKSGNWQWLLNKEMIYSRDEQGTPVQILGISRIITTRKKINEEIKNSREQLQSLVENISGVYWVNDLDNYKTLYISPSYETIWGRKCEDLYSNPADFIDAVHLDDKEKLVAAHEAIRDTRQNTMEFRIVQPDGEIRWISTKANVTIDSMNKAIEYGYAEDITDRKVAEEKLRRSEGKFRTLVEYSPIGIFLCDADGNNIYSNQNVMEMTGLSPEDSLGKSWIKAIHPDDLEMTGKNWQKAIASKTSYEGSGRYLHKNGRIVHWDVVTNPIIIDGQLTGFIGTIKDITETKKSEEERQDLLVRNEQTISTMLDGFILADYNGNILEVNPSYCKMVNYTKEELLQKTISNMEGSLNLQEVKLKMAELIKRNSLKFETKHLKRDQTTIDLSVSIALMNIKEQPLIAIFARDITDRILAEKQIKDYNKKLHELTSHLQNVREEERASLARELHDELGQQLTALKMDLSWIASHIQVEKKFADKLIETLELTNEAVSTVRRINSELRPSLLDDLGLFAAIEYQVNEFARRTKLRCTLKIEMSEPDMESSKSIGIYRVLQESLSNIARHAEASKVSVKISEDNNNMNLVITDNGKGFTHYESSLNKSFGIIGMTERALMLNGNLEIISELGNGTQISLVLPLKVPATLLN